MQGPQDDRPEPRGRGRIQVGIPVKTLTLQTLEAFDSPLRSYKSEQLKPRVSLPQLNKPTPLQQYEFPLQDEEASNKKKHMSKSRRKLHMSEKYLKPHRRKPPEETEQDRIMHKIILNSVLHEEIQKSISEVGDLIIDTYKPKRRVLRGGQNPKRKSTLLENLEQSVLFPKILRLRPFRMESSLNKLLIGISDPQPPFRPLQPQLTPPSKPQLPPIVPKTRPKVYDLAAGSIEAWKDNEELGPLRP